MLLTSSAITSVAQADSRRQCVDLFIARSDDEAKNISDELSEQDEALKKIAIQHFYEGAIRFLQTKITGSSIHSTGAQRDKNKFQLIRFLFAGKHDAAINLYRKVFDNVELSYYRIQQDLETLRRLEAAPESSHIDIAKLELKLQVYQRRFAKHYGEYLVVRAYLEKVSNDKTLNTVFVETAKTTLKYLGIHKFSEIHEDFAALEIPESRVTIQEIKSLFRSKALYTRIKLWNDFKAEIYSVIKYIISSEVIVGTIEGAFNKFPPNVALKLKEFTGLLRSAKHRFRYTKLIFDLETYPSDVPLRLEELRRKNSTTPNDELLITYVRMVDFSDSWNDMKAYAKTKADNGTNRIYQNFYDRMLAAEDKALALKSDISGLELSSNIDTIIVMIQTGLILKYAGPQTFATLNDFFSYAATVWTP